MKNGIDAKAEYLSTLFTTQHITKTHAYWQKDWYKGNLSQLQKFL